jgi:putative oxidoreductase
MTARVVTPTAGRQAEAGWGRRTNIALWVLQAAIAAAILGAGAATVAGAAQPLQMFYEIGLGDWFRYLVGVLQLAGALSLLIPRLCGLAGLAFVGMWLVAIETHLFAIGGNPAPAAVFLVLTAVIAWGRREHTAALFTRPPR